MNREEILEQLQSKYSEIVKCNQITLYYELEKEIDSCFEMLQSSSQDAYSDKELNLLHEVASLHQTIVGMMEVKKQQMTKLNQLAKDNYARTAVTESYFFDKQS
ncbi:hypothetical protein GNP94_19100 [Paenibacillus campinasensis]|uniref:Flagellar protein FliT n=1 Tax=Paenibacillus campinasensis TaxID=66347 RepID=A0ABW9T472_9BACL|nr:hypothetical protein [Paenibacillus campinasensis]MUG68094.1 hypothetical protein [Paenibacillus campinasensis]